MIGFILGFLLGVLGMYAFLKGIYKDVGGK